MNLYAYCANSPINLTDPSGLAPNLFIDPSVVNNPFDDPSMSSLCMDDSPINPYDWSLLSGDPINTESNFFQDLMWAWTTMTTLAMISDPLGGPGSTKAAEGLVNTFWAGPEAGEAAEEFILANGGTKLNLPATATREEIMNASLNAAKNASGNVNVFQSASGVSLFLSLAHSYRRPDYCLIILASFYIVMEDGSLTVITGCQIIICSDPLIPIISKATKASLFKLLRAGGWE